MTQDLAVCAAAFFRSRGKSVVTEKEFLMGASMNMRWMPYGDAERLLAVLIDSGVVEKDGEYIRPKVDVNSLDVPISYRPPAELLDMIRSYVPEKTRSDASPVASEPSGPLAKTTASDDGEDVFQVLMSKATGMGIDRKEFLSSCRAVQKKMNIEIEVAALMVLRDNGADVSQMIGQVHDAVLRK